MIIQLFEEHWRALCIVYLWSVADKVHIEISIWLEDDSGERTNLIKLTIIVWRMDPNPPFGERRDNNSFKHLHTLYTLLLYSEDA